MQDDKRAVAEMYRVTKSGGHMVIFAPNRLFPFETHGVKIGGKIRYGNVPLVGYLPDKVRDSLCPHAKAYTSKDIKKLFSGLDHEVVVDTQIFPGYDRVSREKPVLGKMLQSARESLEKSSLKAFGLSHFYVAKKLA